MFGGVLDAFPTLRFCLHGRRPARRSASDGQSHSLCIKAKAIRSFQGAAHARADRVYGSTLFCHYGRPRLCSECCLALWRAQLGGWHRLSPRRYHGQLAAHDRRNQTTQRPAAGAQDAILGGNALRLFDWKKLNGSCLINGCSMTRGFY
jgi:hypothetical protein